MTEWERVKVFDAVTGEELEGRVANGILEVLVPGLSEYRLIVATPKA